MGKEPVKTWSTPATDGRKRPVPCTLCGGLRFKPSLPCAGFPYARCVSCGLVQMNPQPVEEETMRRYGAAAPPGSGGEAAGGYGEDYLAYELENETAFLNLQLLALKDAGFGAFEKGLFAGQEGAAQGKPRALDIGCAVGSLPAYLRGRGWETTGVEISGPQADYCRRERGLDVRSLPLEENRFPPASFDAVFASHLIEHLNDPTGLVREVSRVLAPGGRFFVTTPNIAGFQARLFRDRWRSAIPDHLYLFSERTLERLLTVNGFAVEKTATWGGLAAGTAPAPVKRFFDKAVKRLGAGDVMIMRAKRKGD